METADEEIPRRRYSFLTQYRGYGRTLTLCDRIFADKVGTTVRFVMGQPPTVAEQWVNQDNLWVFQPQDQIIPSYCKWTRIVLVSDYACV